MRDGCPLGHIIYSFIQQVLIKFPLCAGFLYSTDSCELAKEWTSAWNTRFLILRGTVCEGHLLLLGDEEAHRTINCTGLSPQIALEPGRPK